MIYASKTTNYKKNILKNIPKDDLLKKLPKNLMHWSMFLEIFFLLMFLV